MTEYKSHHYVPQMYMRLFARPDENRVGVYVINLRKFIPEAPIRGQACRNYFYGTDPRAEQAFGRTEGHAARIFAAAIDHHRLPSPGSEDHEWLIFYLGIQHSRTVGAAEQHNEGSEKVAKAMLRRKAELEGNDEILAALDKVRIKRTNAVSELVGYATIGASLLADLKFALIQNESETPFISSDTPVVFHNRLYERQHIRVTGYGNVGLQMSLPLGPRLTLFGYDAAAYDVRADPQGLVQVADPAQVRLINDLQWESADAVLLASPDTAEHEFQTSATDWRGRRPTQRTIFREEVMNRTDTEVRTRHGVGQAPSTISFDLPFVTLLLPDPPPLSLYELPPLRDPSRAARVDRAFKRLDELDARGRAP